MYSTGTMFAVNHGDLGGQYIVLCHSASGARSFVSLPDKEIITVPEEDFVVGVDKDILSFVAELPEDVYAYCRHIYEKEDINN